MRVTELSPRDVDGLFSLHEVLERFAVQTFHIALVILRLSWAPRHRRQTRNMDVTITTTG